jgi:hypothetical protein
VKVPESASSETKSTDFPQITPDGSSVSTVKDGSRDRFCKTASAKDFLNKFSSSNLGQTHTQKIANVNLLWQYKNNLGLEVFESHV